ncbi:MAG: hypothetical protein MRY83_14720 [Flavobacteriales bacterium]|nr:hypothetical protein [Flavobacteriales bacterium]
MERSNIGKFLICCLILFSCKKETTSILLGSFKEVSPIKDRVTTTFLPGILYVEDNFGTDTFTINESLSLLPVGSNETKHTLVAVDIIDESEFRIGNLYASPWSYNHVFRK